MIITECYCKTYSNSKKWITEGISYNQHYLLSIQTTELWQIIVEPIVNLYWTLLIIFHLLLMNQTGESSQNTAMVLKKRTLPVFSENLLYKTWRNKIDM